MQTIIRNSLKLTVALLLIAIMFAGHAPSAAYAAPACASTGSISFDVWAKTGTTTFYSGGPTIPIWGYSSGPTGATDPAGLPGPVLIVDQGQDVTVNLTNNLPEASAMLFQGQDMIPDTAGAAAGGGTQSYTFRACNPGTFLYEAGLTANGQHQVAMGLYGALIVRPTGAPLQAYASPSTAFDTEQVLVLSEFDSASAFTGNPAAFDMRKYAPKYFLINGKAYPGTAPLTVTAGEDVLLRYVNAGLTSHHMGVLGLSQTVLGQDGNSYLYSHKMVSETVAPGQTLDARVTIPASTALGTRFALYDSNLMLRNNTGLTSFAGVGGMLTFLTVGATPPPGTDATGPLLSSLNLSPNPSNGAVSVALSFIANDTTTGGTVVDAAEYSVDGGLPVSIPVGAPATVVTLNATIPSGLTHGTHVVTVRARDALLNWSTTASINLVVDNVGPTTSGLSLTPNPSSGAVGVTLSFTANDTAAGNHNITAAEYWIDAGAPQAISVASPAPVKILTVGLMPPFSAGTHVVSVRSQDAVGNWGATTTINLVVDNTGPATSGVSATYNPNNGTKPFSTAVQAVRVTATFNDSLNGNSNVVAGEGFIDTIGTTGTGFAFTPTDGSFNSSSEAARADVPLPVINALATGNHTIYVHGKDAVGNWGAMGTVVLVIDRTPPAITSINRADPNPTSAASVNFLVTFSEDVTGVTSSNFALVQGGGLTGATITSVTGTGATRTVTATTGSNGGTLGLDLTSATGIADIAGNALPSAGLPFVGQVYTVMTPPLYFSTSGNVNPPGAGGTADDADIYLWNGSAFSRDIDVTAITNPLPGGANVDGFDRVSGTQFYMSFNNDAGVAVPGVGTVQDEDIVMRNGTTWTLYFDGSANGISGTDLDAISIVGAGGPGNIYFSTNNTTVPPGAGGTGDDADIYRWNGGSSYTRVFDASALGWSTNNIDGFVHIDATHFYLSYSPDNSTIVLPGPDLTIQDEDVVYYNAGVWSVYFDGTGKGLTDAGEDVDAFDLP